tara:strand:- start:98 stop:667 length:570 start_codon:yes stop_codon:yes gene_type:complete
MALLTDLLSTNTTNIASNTTAVANAGGAWNLVAEVTPSSSATVELTGMDSTYVTYAIIASDVLLSSGNNITFTIKQGGSYDNNNYYAAISSQYSGSNNITGAQWENQVNQRITENNTPTNSFVMYIYSPSNASGRTAYYVQHTGHNDGSAYRTQTNGMQNTVGATTAILFDCGNANFSSGSFKLYGIGG